MKRAFLLIAFVFCLNALAQPSHPRLLMSDAQLSAARQKLVAGDEAVTLLHQQIMELADSCVKVETPVEYRHDASGRRILQRSREAMLRIGACAYAYRFTGEKSYLQHALFDLETVCAFPDWNTKHFLDPCEMATAVAIGYDWLYDAIPVELKAKCEKTVREFAVIPALAPHQFYIMTNNWNQVCNSGLVMASLSVLGPEDPMTKEIIERAVETNSSAMDTGYYPDGNYPEGPVYWAYGTMYEVLMLTAMEDILGTDFGLAASTPGFERTALFQTFTVGTTGMAFNYADNASAPMPATPLWYFAWKQGRHDFLEHEIALLKKKQYTGRENIRFIPLLMSWAARMPSESSAPAVREKFFSGNGITPVAMVHTDWTFSPSDRFLGIKAGQAGSVHAHMDAGSFVYDAHGYRWAMDMDRQPYAGSEVRVQEAGGSLWDMDQKSLRWRFFRYNNHQHNTLTVNDKDHFVGGFAKIVHTCPEGAKLGAVLDMTAVFGGDLKQARRGVFVVDEDYLEVADTLAAPSDRSASVRWTLVTPAKVNVRRNCILLTQGDVTLKLHASSPKRVKISYKQWSSDPKDYDYIFSDFDTPIPGTSICGFELTVPAGETVILSTTLKE
ncbi:MAG: heparinase II/III-family protein [Bacteroidales bacterium]|nr:heparinase II/III-family protein [Bacteroidales bacterium]